MGEEESVVTGGGQIRRINEKSISRWQPGICWGIRVDSPAGPGSGCVPGPAVGTFSKGRAGSPATDVGPPPALARREMPVPGAPRGQHLAASGGRIFPFFFPTGLVSRIFESVVASHRVLLPLSML